MCYGESENEKTQYLYIVDVLCHPTQKSLMSVNRFVLQTHSAPVVNSQSKLSFHTSLTALTQRLCHKGNYLC